MTDRIARQEPRLVVLLAVTSLGAILAPLNSTMLTVALPEIRQDFGLSHSQVGWLISGYLIAMAVVQPAGGRLGDQIGRQRVYRWGLVAFLVVSLAATAAPNFPALVTLRIGQAVVGAVLIPNAMAMLRELVPGRRLGRMNGLNSAIVSLAAAVGPLIGSLALAGGSWRILFPINIPVILAALILLPALGYQDAPGQRRTGTDWTGTALFIAFLVTLTFQLGALRAHQSNEEAVFGWGLAAVLAVGLALRQSRTSRPVAEWGLFRLKSFAAGTAHTMLTNLTMYTTLLMVPFFIQEVQGKSAATTGALLGTMALLMAIPAPIGGRLADAYGRRRPAVAGSLLACTGSVALLLALSSGISFITLILLLALIGFGVGLGVGPATTAAIEAAPAAVAGAAAGTTSMMRYFGSILGAGLLAGVLDTGSDIAPEISVFRAVAAVVVVMSALAAVAATALHDFPPEMPRRPLPLDQPGQAAAGSMAADTARRE
jgi:DHA2 family methylenomycin A resistance protein-like MFS transporter